LKTVSDSEETATPQTQKTWEMLPKRPTLHSFCFFTQLFLGQQFERGKIHANFNF
jgi:hypothetical protein